MKFTRKGSVYFIAGAVAGIAACGGDESPGTSSPTDGGASSTSSGGSSSGTTSSSGGSSSGATTGDGGGAEGGTTKAIGEGPCAVDTECKSGVCFVGNGKDSYCTIKCTMIGAQDPVCTALGA